MKKIFFCLQLVFLIFFVKINSSNASTQSKIIAGIDNEIITSYELKNKIITNIILNNKKLNQENINRLKNQALKSLINYKLKKKEVIKFNLLKKDIDTSEHVKEISNKYSTGVQEFKKIFVDNNLSYDLYLEEIEIDLAWQQLILNLYGKKINVDEKEIDEELKKIINNQKNIIQYKLSEIEVQIEDGQKTNDLIEKIKNLIDEDGFENTAIKYSISLTAMDGGDLGWVNSKSLSNEILNVVNNMKLKEISKPIFQTDSILFIKLKDKKKLNLDKINLNETKKGMIIQRKNEILNLFSNSHLSKIRNNAFIELK